MDKTWMPYSINYDPLKAGSIDGTDTEPHDRAISRAMEARYEPPYGLKSDPDRTLYVARFGPNVTTQDLKEFFSRFGEVISAKVVVDLVTGLSRGYGFVEMTNVDEAKKVLRHCYNVTLRGYRIFIDFECGRIMKGWKPRRLGGGFGGAKESGQLRFGGKERPFMMPIQHKVDKL